jgi:hypothetical protein
MGRYRGKHIPDEYNPGYANVEGMDETWYWYMAGYEDGLDDDYNRKTDETIKRLGQDISSMNEQAAARERVLIDLQRRYEELQKICDTPVT